MKLPINRLLKTLCALFVVSLILTQTTRAQVPQLLNYQGVIEVDNASFSGEGAFKFALVNGAGSSSFWSNDGSSVAGSEPTTAVSLSVDDGFYSVLLGDATLTNMTVLPATVFTNAEVYLRIWFSDGSNGFQQLAPDQQIAAVGYAMMAGQVANASITADKLAPGAAADNLNATGGVILSQDSNYELESAGYRKLGQFVSDASWRVSEIMPETPDGRYNHSAVWTGTEMIIWGGYTGGPYYGDGAAYNPVTDTWRDISDVGAPSPRSTHVAVWTGTEMLIWGGVTTGTTAMGDGALYDPATDSWRTMSTEGAPSARFDSSLVWTGLEAVIWGGWDGSSFNTGGRYNPATDTWLSTETTGAPTARRWHGAVWTGGKMIIWGATSSSFSGSGGIYDPLTDSWEAMSIVDAPLGRRYHAFVWSGTELLVWGGLGAAEVDTGGRYNLADDSWEPITQVGALSARYYHNAVWTGREMVVYGGYDGSTAVGTGALYNPELDLWTALSEQGSSGPQYRNTVVWTGDEMILWGNSGVSGSGWKRDTGIYKPGIPMMIYGKP